MWNKIRNLWLILLFVTSVLANEGDDWYSQSWLPISQTGSLEQPKEFDRALQGFAFKFNGPQSFASETVVKSQVVNPFAHTFASKSFTPTFGPFPNYKPQPQTTIYNNPLTASKNTKPYAPKFTKPYKQNYNPKYVIPKYQVPKSNKPINQYNLNRYATPSRTNKIVVNQNPPKFVPQNNKAFHPFKAVSAKLYGYNYDNPVVHHIKQNIDESELRLKQQEQAPLHQHTESSIPDKEGEEKFHKKEQNEGYTPEYEPYNALNNPDYYAAPQKYQINYGRIQNKLQYPGPNIQNIKIHPQSYQPIKNYINELKLNQGKTFSEGKNEYPEVRAPPVDDDEEPDGYDIFDRQRAEFDFKKITFKPNFDRFTQKHHPNKALETSSNNDFNRNHDHDSLNAKRNEDDFIPVKMYAQVRHSESVKHLPREAALEDAVTYDDVLNAPRLREAIKTSKAQTVYTEEGYEDNAYDHAGHLKHASNHEGHGGYVKNKEEGAGKYKNGGGHKYEDGGRTLSGEDIKKGKKWFLDEGNSEKFNNHDSYSAKDGEYESKGNDLDEAGSEKRGVQKPKLKIKPPQKIKGAVNKLVITSDQEQTMVKDTEDGVVINTKSKHISMNNEPTSESDKKKFVRLRPKYYWKNENGKKRENSSNPDNVEVTLNAEAKNSTDIKKAIKTKYPDVLKRTKREDDFFKPFINFDKEVLTDDEVADISNEKLGKPKPDLRHIKYPYYNMKPTKIIHKNSPLRYSENFAMIPKKTAGGSEFYESRSDIICEDVVENIDPVPDRIKNKTPESESEESGEKRSKRKIIIKTTLKRSKRDNFEQNKEQPRLRGLGDKIDCFKDKYFGSNPLDSPFFDEDEIAPPEPIKAPAFFFLPSTASSYKSDDKIDFILPTPRSTFTTKLYPVSSSNRNEETVKLETIKIIPTTFRPPISTAQSKLLDEIAPTLLTGEVGKKYDLLKNNLHTNLNKYAQLKKISLPNAIFDKYALSRDPQMRVYGDVMGTIKASLNDDGSDPLTKLAHPNKTYKKNDTHDKPNYVSSLYANLPYRSFKNKEDIHNPSMQVRIARDNHFVYEPYKIIQQQQLRTKKTTPTVLNLRPMLKKPKRINIAGQASTTIETIVDLVGQPVKRNAKIYVDIGKNERRLSNIEESSDSPIFEALTDLNTNSTRNATNESSDESFDERRGEPKYENGEDSFHKNHKKYYSPVVAKTSITPEELNVEYLLKSKEDKDHILSELKKLDEEETERLLIEDIATKVTQHNDTIEPKEAQHRFQGKQLSKILPSQSPTVFDVSAYLPKPITINNFYPRYNLSSRYNSKPEEAENTTPLSIDKENIDQSRSSEETYADTQNDGDEVNKSAQKETIRHTIEIRPTKAVPETRNRSRKRFTTVTTERPYVETTEYTIIREKPKTTESTIHVATPQAKKRRRIKLTTTTTTVPYTEADYYVNEEPTTKPKSYSNVQSELLIQTTEQTAISSSSEEEDSSNDDDDSSSEEEVQTYSPKKKSKLENDADDALTQWRRVLSNQNSPSRSEERIEQVKPTRRIRPTPRSTTEMDMEREIVSRKPRIVEKTSKKRKTTVITNSKRYDNTATPEPQLEQRRIKKPRRRNSRRKQVPVEAEKRSDDDELDSRETGRLIKPKTTYKENEQNSESRDEEMDEMDQNKSQRLRQGPIKEESRYEEDVEEEEVIQERNSPSMYTGKSFDFYRDPTLAKQVNRLSDAKKQDQHSVHSDVEIFRADFQMNKGPKHGGNYKKIPTGKKTRKRLDEVGELEDLNVGTESIEEPMHGGNYRKIRDGNSDGVEDLGISAKVLNSFASLLPIATTTTTTPKPLFEKNPGKRLYYFLKV